MIRPLDANDLDQYIALRQQALRECPLAFSASAEDDFASSPETLSRQLKKAPDWMIFVESGGDAAALQGCVGLFRARHAKAGHRMHLWGMYVAPEHRGRGLGAQLLHAAIAHARSLGDVAWIDLGVTTAAPAAMQLYERAGFIPYGVLRDALRFEGNSADEIFMTCTLTDGIF